MSQSLSKINVHCVFSTKNHEPFIKKEIQSELHSYIVGILSNTGSYVYELYANPDHIHVLCILPKTITIAQLISKIKTPSSKWMKLKGYKNFSWQDGYASFSVSSSKVDDTKKYIANQAEHHKKFTFKDELRSFLKKYNLEFDEKYIWD